MSVKSKALVVLSVPLLMLAATTALTYRALRESEATEARVRHAYYVKDRIQRVRDDLLDVETGVRGYLLTDEPEFLDPYWRGSSALALDLQYLQLAVGDETSDLDMLRLRVLAKRRVDIVDRLLAVAEDHSTEEPDTLTLLRRGRIVMDEIRALLRKMTMQQQERVDAAQRGVERTRRDAFVVAVGGAPMGMGLALVVVLLFNGRVVRRLARVHANVRRLELGQPMVLDDDSRDEIGRLGQALVKSGTLAIELREELQRLATIDSLTGLANRRGLMPLLEHQLELARRQHEPVSILFVDLDGLKMVNDMLGHREGDEMIVEAAALLRDTFRSSDVPARIGGDEFCVVLTAESAVGTNTADLRLQAALDFANRLPGRVYHLSMSMGLATFDPDRPVSADDLLAEADRRMYEHKRSKRRDTSALFGVR
jgi:diguanylate cyclase (GGDEF)-like protein